MNLNNKGSIYYECKEEIKAEGTQFYSAEKTTLFLNQCLKNNFSIIVTNTVHPHEKLKERLLQIAYPLIYFIDCTSCAIADEEQSHLILKEKTISLTSLDLTIHQVWNEIKGKRCIFFDSGSLLFIRFKKIEVFEFIHNTILKYGKDGLVVFQFVKGTLDSETERQLKCLFDIVIME